jgi:hypothetical protein
MALLPTRDIVLAGDDQASTPPQIAAVRFNDNGSIDTGFGTAGVRTLNPPYAIDVGTPSGGVVPQSDGGLMFLGASDTASGWDISMIRLGGTQVADYSNLGGGGDTDWSGGANMFGACLRDTPAGGLTSGSTWSEDTTDQDCLDGDGDPWRAIPAIAGASAVVANAPSTVANAEARLRFGFRAAATQPAGRYEAPVTFDVIAPAV